ncbi:MAG: glycosyltransferase family 2 protein [Fimbriiglobus sp.]|nr:glycosyltransferase family 2 protein [Fimbriiglobus sp.]
MSEPVNELLLARRRIDQLEAALARRTELLERRTAELADVQGGKAYQFAHFVHKVINRLAPLHTRRRRWLQAFARRGMGAGKWFLRRVRPSGGLPPEQRHFIVSTPPDEYKRWIAAHEPGAAELELQRRKQFAHTPTFSVVVPVFNPPAAYVEAMLASVAAQTYPHWELCLADASTASHVRPLLEKFAAAEPRVKVQFLDNNLGIAGNSNAAAALATGEFICLLDHDDTLAPFALHELADAVQLDPAIDFLYSDEDKLDPTGLRVDPYFKPDWSPETLRSRNYICHLTCLRRELFHEVGGFRAGFEGSQDYDLVLRATERAKRITHIPQVLYHWRIHPQSTAGDQTSKMYAYESGRKAVAEHLTRSGVDATVHDGPVLGTYHVVYHLRTQPLVSVVIPNKDHPDVLARCVDSLAKASYANYELLIVENGSTDPQTHALYAELKKQPHVRVLEWAKPFNYAAVNNFAAAEAKGDLLLFLNNDIEAINPDWLEELVKIAVQPGVGAVGAKLLYADDTIQHAGIVVGMGGVAGHAHLNYPRTAPGHGQRLLFTQNVAAVTGACLLMPRAVFRQIGGFDEGFVLAFNDVDICLKVLQAGYRVVWTPDALLYHLESKTRGYEDTPEKQARFKRECDLFHSKWGDFLKAGDPYYSPHFRLDRHDYALRAA